MACYYPITAYRLDNGQISFNEKGKTKTQLTLPCGRCVGCRLERSRQWAIRCMHESQMHKDNCFVTLTYNDEHYQPGLNYAHFQKFIRRLRKKTGKNIRYYMAGEYGETYGRPHFHACLFGYRPDDLELFRQLPSGSNLYVSKKLADYWSNPDGISYGYVSIGDVTFESAAYVARYIMKKQLGKNSSDKYACDDRTGELIPISPEFNRMSLKPGIGRAWLDKYKSDVYPNGTCVVNGMKIKPPKYYDKFYEQLEPLDYERLQYERVDNFNYQDNTIQRLADKEIVAKAKLQFKKRGFQE